MSQWGSIYAYLKSHGFDVYSPGQHQGDCISNFVVLKTGGALLVPGTSSTKTTYEILCYVPGDQFSTLEPFVDSVETAMRGMRPGIQSLNYRTPSYYDPGVKGHMISIQYYNYRKL